MPEVQFSLMDYRNRGGEDKENYNFKTGSGNERNTIMRNPHPTVKPLKLAIYLASLLLPPDAYAPRRLLNPFGGSGSEAIGAMLAGWDEVTYIDSDTEHGYVDIARKRAAYWQAQQMNQLRTLFEVEAWFQ